MIKLNRHTPVSAEFVRWRQRAQTAMDRLIADALAKNTEAEIGGKIQGPIYKAHKTDLFVPSFGKCVFCETRDKGVSAHGDVEHFRPKAAVQDRDSKPVVRADGKLHPGYYWLGYEWDNFVPSCALCNQLSNPTGTKLIGKGNRFPIAGTRAERPTDALDAEQPLLLNPFDDDPSDHLELKDPLLGILGWKTPRGEVTVEILGLNRDQLCTARQEAYQHAFNAAAMTIIGRFNAHTIPGYPAVPDHPRVIAIRDGSEPYAFVGRKALEAAEQVGQLR